jgi:hypothetical protein
MFGIAFRSLTALVAVGVLWIQLSGVIYGQSGWSQVLRLPSPVATRWATIVPAPDRAMHSFWAAAEPGVSADSDVQQVYLTSYHTIMYSKSQDSVTWTEPLDILYDDEQIDGLRALSTPSRLHVFWNSNCLHHASLPHTASTTSAHAWMSTPSCIAPRAIAEGVAVTQEDNRIYLVYSAGDALIAQISIDDGITWDTGTLVASAAEVEGAAILAYPAVAAHGESLYVVWEAKGAVEQNYEGRGVYFAQSSDLGRSWSIPQRISDINGAQPSIAVDRNGTIHLLWNTPVGISQRVYVRSNDAGKNWQDTSVLFDKELDGDTAGLQGPPALIVGQNGQVFTLFGTNSGPRFREQIDGTWGISQALDVEPTGETWITGLIQLESSGLCAYWNGMETPSSAFSIRCRAAAIGPETTENAADMVTEANTQAVSAFPDAELTRVPSTVEYDAAEIDDARKLEYPNRIQLTDSQRRQMPYYVLGTSPVLVGVLASTFVIVVVIVARKFQRAHRT